jgi:hypothetical protein
MTPSKVRRFELSYCPKFKYEFSVMGFDSDTEDADGSKVPPFTVKAPVPKDCALLTYRMPLLRVVPPV